MVTSLRTEGLRFRGLGLRLTLSAVRACAVLSGVTSVSITWFVGVFAIVTHLLAHCFAHSLRAHIVLRPWGKSRARFSWFKQDAREWNIRSKGSIVREGVTVNRVFHQFELFRRG